MYNDKSGFKVPILVHSYIKSFRKNMIVNDCSYSDYLMLYVFNGKGIINIYGKRYDLYKGDLILCKLGDLHNIIYKGNDEIRIICIFFNIPYGYKIYDFLDELKYTKNQINVIDYFDRNVMNSIIRVNNPAVAEELLFFIASEFSYQDGSSHEIADLVFLTFLFLVMNQISKNPCQYAIDKASIVDSVTQYIYRNIDKPVTNKMIGEHLNFHPNYINRLIVTATGMSLHKYVINIKINKAIEMLSSSSMSVCEIATAVGFNQANSFTQIFKKELGSTPTKYIAKSNHVVKFREYK